VVGDGLSFPVGVRGQVDAVRVPGGPLQLGDDLFLAGNDAVFGGEVPVNVNAELLGGFPRILLMVFAFAGDSTMTSAFFAIDPLSAT
jgi:hypothetical protein